METIDLRENYEMLAVAIVTQAVFDYRRAKKKLNKYPNSIFAKDRVRETTRFFESDYCYMLTGIPGETIISAMKEEM